MPQPALISGPGIKAFGRPAHRALSLSLGNGRSDGNCYCLGDLVLHRKDVREIAVVALGPDVVAGFGLDQLRGDADAVAGFTQAAFEHVAHAKLAPDLAKVRGFALVGKARIAGDDEEPRQPRDRGNDLLDDAVDEILLLGIAAHVL